MHLLSALLVVLVSYNVENLFHPERDTVNHVPKEDTEWTPDGEHHWNYTRYHRKVENIARVLTNIGEWDGVDIVGLQEVENAQCVKHLCRTLRRGEYDYVHYESPDRRGIDVALLYKKARVDTIRTRAIPVYLSATETTRDILYACVCVDRRDTLHLLVCHMPSQRGGAAKSQWKRDQAKQVLQTAVDSVLELQPNAKIIVMGDMNSAPKDDIRGLRNRMMTIDNAGTHKHQGQWICLDQFYTSTAVSGKVSIYDAEWIQEPDEKYMDLKPKRTYNGYRYQNGYSDHLPIVLTLENNL